MNTCTNITPLYGLSAEAKEAISKDMSVFSVYDRPDYLVYTGRREGVLTTFAGSWAQLGVFLYGGDVNMCCPYEVACDLQGQEQVDEIIRWASHYESLLKG